MKSVLISIRPDWIQKIFDGEKTVEIRKTFPKLPPPFKCFIYCTKPRHEYEDMILTEPASFVFGGGMVVGEFVCDAVERLDMDSVGLIIDRTKEYTDWNPCMTRGEMMAYTGGRKPYGWHISELKVYEKPKPLSDFHKPGAPTPDELDEYLCHYCEETDYGEHKMYGTPNGSVFCEGAWCEDAYLEYLDDNGFTLTRPPQSWCYVDGGLIG